MAISIPSSPILCAPIPRRRTPTSQSLSLSPSNSSFFGNAAFSHRSGPSRVRVLRRTNGTGGLSCNCLFGLGVPELVVIAGVAALVFGPKKLPEVGRSIGKAVKSFQQAAKEFETELKKEPDSTAELPAEKPTAASEEEKEAKVPSTKENL